MPTPPPRVDTVTHPDGSTTTTTTRFYPNEQPRSVETVRKDRRGNPRDIRKKEFRRDGKQTAEAHEKRDARGRKDEATKTDFDKNGHPKRRAHAEYDNQEREVRTVVEKFKNNRKTTSETTDIDYSARPPRKVVRTEKWCTDHVQIELKVIRVFYNRAGRWHEEKRERRTERYDCRTGRRIAWRFPSGVEDYAALGLLAVTVFSAGAGWTRGDNLLWLLALAALAAAAALYVRSQSRAARLQQMVGDLAFAMCHDDEVEEPDLEGDEPRDEDRAEEPPEEDRLEEPHEGP